MAESDKDKAQKLIRIYQANLARKLQEGKSLTDKKLKHLQDLALGGDLGSDESQTEDIGIPKRLQVKRQYTLSEEALAQRWNAAKSSKRLLGTLVLEAHCS